MNDVDFDGGRCDQLAGVARVLSPVLCAGLLDDQRADGRRGLVGQHTHAAAGARVINGLQKKRKRENKVAILDL